MLQRFAVLAVTLFAGLPLFCQPLTVARAAAFGDDYLYDAFFYKVTWLENRADHMALEGKDPSFYRSVIRKEARLSIEDAALVKTVATDWRIKNDQIVADGNALFAKLGIADSPRLQDLARQRRQLVLDHLARLRTALGPAKFFQLDLYVRQRAAFSRTQVAVPQKRQ